MIKQSSDSISISIKPISDGSSSRVWKTEKYHDPFGRIQIMLMIIYFTVVRNMWNSHDKPWVFCLAAQLHRTPGFFTTVAFSHHIPCLSQMGRQHRIFQRTAVMFAKILSNWRECPDDGTKFATNHITNANEKHEYIHTYIDESFTLNWLPKMDSRIDTMANGDGDDISYPRLLKVLAGELSESKFWSGFLWRLNTYSVCL